MSVPRRRSRPAFAIALGLAFVAGCDQPGSARPRAKAKPVEVVEEPAAPEAPAKPEFIVGKTTQDIRDVDKEKAAGGVVVQPRITAKDPITLQGNAYVSIIGQTSILQIQQALDLYQATNGAYPKTRDEFMEKVIKENHIRLPKLPFYQEYGYDVPNHKLIILEYPTARSRPTTPSNTESRKSLPSALICHLRVPISDPEVACRNFPGCV